MNDEMLRSLGWVGLGIGIAVVAMVLELLLRTLINRRGESPDPSLNTQRK